MKSTGARSSKELRRLDLNVGCQGSTPSNSHQHDDVIKWKHFPRYWPFVRGIHRSPVNSPHTGQWPGALMFSLICTRITGWVNNGEAGDSRRHRAHYDVTVMGGCQISSPSSCPPGRQALSKSGTSEWFSCTNYINPGYGLSLVDTLWNASSYRQPLEQEGNPMT